MNLFKRFLLINLMVASLGFCFASTKASAKDLTGRLGVGFIDQFANSTVFKDIPNISAKYALTKDLAVLGCFGLHTQSPGGYTFCGKVFKNIFYETNMNFYVAAAAAFLKSDQSGVEFQGLFGMEAFIPGIDSLGLSFEAGTSLSNLSGSFVVKTVGFTFLQAGVHFYF